MSPKPRHSLVRLFILLALLAAAVWVMVNRQFVVDQLSVWDYKPTADVAAITERVAMTDEGTFYFYASHPKIDDREAFNQHCQQLVEKSAVLGCYASRQIYIFNITDARLYGIREVTAAHEMLHAAYDRLSVGERARIDALIEQQTQHITNPKLQARLDLYAKTEPGERLNELHSILGTEIGSLSSELESYYARYFVKRSDVVALSSKYEKVFDEIEQKQQSLVAEMNSLADQVATASSTYTNALATLQADITNFNRRADGGGFADQAAFTVERNRLVARQERLQADRDAINGQIDLYNQKKAELDALNTTAEGLQKSINSTALPEAPSL
ncbi:MAG: hypothetical protein WAT17_03250 [Candidatus Saccharimonadales bacterium]